VGILKTGSSVINVPSSFPPLAGVRLRKIWRSSVYVIAGRKNIIRRKKKRKEVYYASGTREGEGGEREESDGASGSTHTLSVTRPGRVGWTSREKADEVARSRDASMKNGSKCVSGRMQGASHAWGLRLAFSGESGSGGGGGGGGWAAARLLS